MRLWNSETRRLLPAAVFWVTLAFLVFFWIILRFVLWDAQYRTLDPQHYTIQVVTAADYHRLADPANRVVQLSDGHTIQKAPIWDESVWFLRVSGFSLVSRPDVPWRPSRSLLVLEVLVGRVAVSVRRSWIMDRISVGEASRRFEELVDRVSRQGVTVELERDNRIVARLSPVGCHLQANDLQRFFASLPPLGDDARAFARDLETRHPDTLVSGS